MNINTISYWIAEAAASIMKNQKIFWSGVAIMSGTLFLISLFYVAFGISNSLIEMVEETQGKIGVFLKEIDQEQTDKVENALLAINGVESVEYISKEQAKLRAEASAPEDFLTSVEDDFYPPSFNVSIEDLSMAKQIAFEIRGIDGVGEKESDVQFLDNIDVLAKVAVTIKVLAVTIFIVATVLSCFIMMNSIKLMLYSRRREISIMKYVGATDLFTKAPFVIEGLVIAIIGAGISVAVTGLICGGLESIAGASMLFSFLGDAKELIPSLAIILLVLAAGVGTIGSSMSISKYLDV